VLFHVIPAKAGIQYFHGAANTLDPGFHRGDKYSVISSQLQGKKGEGMYRGNFKCLWLAFTADEKAFAPLPAAGRQ